MDKKHNINLEEFVDLYKNKGLIYKELAIHFNCKIGIIRKFAKRHKVIPIRGKGKKRKSIIEKTKIPLTLNGSEILEKTKIDSKELEIIISHLFAKSYSKIYMDYLTPRSLSSLFKNYGEFTEEKVRFKTSKKSLQKYFYQNLKMPCFFESESFFGEQNLVLTKRSSKKFLNLINPYLQNDPVETSKAIKVSREDLKDLNIAENPEKDCGIVQTYVKTKEPFDQAIGRKLLMVDELIR